MVGRGTFCLYVKFFSLLTKWSLWQLTEDPFRYGHRQDVGTISDFPNTARNTKQKPSTIRNPVP